MSDEKQDWREWTLRVVDDSDGYIFSGSDVSYPGDDYLEVIEAKPALAEIARLRTENNYYSKELARLHRELNEIKKAGK